MSETHVKRAIIDAMNATGKCRVWSTPSGRIQVRGGWMSLAPEGTPDICGYSADGRFVGIEVKIPGKHKTNKDREAKQHDAQQMIHSAGGISGQVTDADGALAILERANVKNYFITTSNRNTNTEAQHQ